ncbi:hypothetical protein CK203_043428 [Vitis vinifera]|uniref:Uncharacterized protein n=1 Tax=Vitis vinifera TaxID=29760 RepID=A0A438IAM1_VITVI|nr:hypothetical protein CK203_043428 [Vitis vinifera]
MDIAGGSTSMHEGASGKVRRGGGHELKSNIANPVVLVHHHQSRPSIHQTATLDLAPLAACIENYVHSILQLLGKSSSWPKHAPSAVGHQARYTYAATKHSTPHLRTLLFFKLDSGSFGMPQVFGLKGNWLRNSSNIYRQFKEFADNGYKLSQVTTRCDWRMENLRHLSLDGRRDDMLLRIETLQNLRTLSGIRVNKWK